jgi:hypothetical protein
MTVAIWRPVSIGAQHARVRPPNPAVILRLDPVAICCKLFGSPHVVAGVLDVITNPRGEITIPFVYPLVVRVAWRSGKQVPVAGVIAGRDQLSRAAVA